MTNALEGRTVRLRPPATALIFTLSLATLACSSDPTQPVTSAPDLGKPSVALATLVTSSGIADQFTTLNTSVWWQSAYQTPTKNGYFRTSNATVAGGNLELWLPKNTYDGGQVETRLSYGYGTYEAIMKCSPARSALCTVYSYASNGDEIDIEVYYSGGWKLDFLVWKRGVKSCRQAIAAPFDPSAAYHTYTYAFSSSAVRFYVDGVLKSSCVSTLSLPAPSMKFLLSAWQPSWLNVSKPTSTTATRVTAAYYRP
ncbi:MAG: family 16 glycosylhydrolase [Gemmatimonadetes bacterium]|nr:family 16 glycosylhydrolase [Gemmatimonadota bacterium]MCC6770390.1 family 16 glycosylhydrolase [Gemmatimonadaceae bacterium]